MPSLVRTSLLTLVCAFSISALSAPSAFAVGSGINGLIYYTTDDSHGTAHIWAMNPDGSDQHQVTPNVGETSIGQAIPSISPNGLELAYTLFSGSHQSIVTQPIAGGAQTNITETVNAVPESPSYCGNGSIAYLGDFRGDSLWDVYRDQTDITNTQWPEVSPPAGHYQSEYTENDVQCSEDNSILFTRLTDASHPLPGTYVGGDTSTVELWTLSPLETGLGVERTFYAIGGGQQISNVKTAAWSADGSKIAFIATTVADGSDQLFTMNADGSGVTPLGETLGGPLSPPSTPGGISWSPDGTKIAYTRADTQIEEVTLADDSAVAISNVIAYSHIDWAPGPGSSIGTPVTWAPVPAPPSPAVLLATVSKPTTTTIVKFARRGLSSELTCNEACTARGELFITAALARKLKLLRAGSKRKAPFLLGSAIDRRMSSGRFELTIEPSAKAKRALARLATLSLTETVTITAANGRSVTRNSLKLTSKRP